MRIDTDKVLSWLGALIDGVENQNNDAERVAIRAMHSGDIVDALKLFLRASTVHCFTPSENDSDICGTCGENFRDTFRHLTSKDGAVDSLLAEAVAFGDAVLREIEQGGE